MSEEVIVEEVVVSDEIKDVTMLMQGNQSGSSVLPGWLDFQNQVLMVIFLFTLGLTVFYVIVARCLKSCKVRKASLENMDFDPRHHTVSYSFTCAVSFLVFFLISYRQRAHATIDRRTFQAMSPSK